MKYEEYDSIIMGIESSVCYIVDFETYELLHLTKGGMKVTGLKSKDEFLGKKCYKLLQGLDAPCPFCTNAKLKFGEIFQWEHYNVLIDRWFDVNDTIITLDGRKCRLEYAKDITNFKRNIAVLSEKLTIEDVLLECLKTLAKENDCNTAFNRFLERLCEFYDADRTYIFEFDEENRLVNNMYEWCSDRVDPLIGKYQNVPISIFDKWIDRFKCSGDFALPSEDNELNNHLITYGLDGILAAPLFFDDKIMGFIGVNNPKNRRNDMTLLRASANFITEELKKYHLFNRLKFAGYTDMLTGLHNRNKYMEILHGYEVETPKSLGIIFADINGMKTINDTYGHKYGDKFIIQISELLKKHANGNAYRIGGDEFIILYDNIDRKKFRSIVMDLKSDIDGSDAFDLSIGCVWSSGEMDVNNLVIQADELMYAEKQSYYKDVLSHGRVARTGITGEVMREISENRFVVFYQPQIDIKSGCIIGAEALVRKKGPCGGLIAPDKFIPYYEIEGIIRHIDLFVVENACATLEKWRKCGIDLRISVNLSRITLLEENIVAKLIEVCNRQGVSPNKLTIEVTESISRIDQDRLHMLLSEMTAAGFTVSLDDFGSKYSNLSILSDMNFSIVKIDKSLVDELENNDNIRIIMRNIIRMCREMKSTHILAEGIETEGQMQLLTDYDCEYGQGFLFSKPLSIDEFDNLLSEKVFA